jgi:hypothetical protein
MRSEIVHGASGVRPGAPRPALREAALAAAFFGLLAAVFLADPLTGGGYYAATGILQHSALFRVDGSRPPATNPVLHDPVSQMHPFLAFNRNELRAGRLPLWNPYNGHGAPHLANYQSAVLSPFSLPFYLLPWRAALVTTAFAKLFLLAFLTWLFLRAARIGFWGAVLGGTVFAFSGWTVAWLQWPHSSATVALPAMMLATERALAATGRRRRGWLAALATAVGLGMLAGHPETMLFALLLVGAYAIARLASRVRSRGGTAGAALGRAAFFAATWAGAVTLGAGLAAVQLLPFAEYLRESAVYAGRTGNHELHALPVELAPLVAFPNLLGNPSKGYYDPVLRNGLNYNEATSHYGGLIALLLAALAVTGWPRHRSRRVLFFAAVAVLWLLYAYDVAGLGRLAGRLPVLGLAVISRSQPVWLFALSFLAAFGLDRVTVQERRGDREAAVGPVRVLLAAALLLALALTGARALLGWAAERPGSEVATVEARAFRGEHLLRQTAGLAAAAGALSFALRRRARGGAPSRFARAAPALAVLLAFIETGYLLRAYNPTIDRGFFYPRPPQLEWARAVVGDAPALWLGGAPMPPDVNLWYRLSSPGIYDAMSVLRYDRAYRRLLGAAPYVAAANPRSLRALQAMGVRFVVTTDEPPWPPRRNGAPRVDGLETAGRWGRIRVYEVPDALPRFFTAGEAVVKTADDRALDALARPRFPIGRRVVLHEAEALDHRVAPARRERVTVLDERPGRVRLSVHRDAPGWLVALFTHFPGWRALVDGRPAPIHRANVAFSSVPVPAGAHQVVLEYRPGSVRWGLATSGVSLLVLLTLFVTGWPGGRVGGGARGGAGGGAGAGVAPGTPRGLS